jgi:hypothetical protein
MKLAGKLDPSRPLFSITRSRLVCFPSQKSRAPHIPRITETEAHDKNSSANYSPVSDPSSFDILLCLAPASSQAPPMCSTPRSAELPGPPAPWPEPTRPPSRVRSAADAPPSGWCPQHCPCATVDHPRAVVLAVICVAVRRAATTKGRPWHRSPAWGQLRRCSCPGRPSVSTQSGPPQVNYLSFFFFSSCWHPSSCLLVCFPDILFFFTDVLWTRLIVTALAEWYHRLHLMMFNSNEFTLFSVWC